MVSAKSRWAIIGLMVVAGCRMFSNDGGGSISGDGRQGVKRSRLENPKTLQNVVAGKIKPVTGAPGNLISASISGEPTVNDDGSASYRIPIWVPDGINGLQPSLAVEYNSGGGTGILGPRWHLS